MGDRPGLAIRQAAGQPSQRLTSQHQRQAEPSQPWPTLTFEYGSPGPEEYGHQYEGP